jgi:hypothetical protein
LVCDSINLASFAYVGYKLIRNPQKHLVVLCFCFGTAAAAFVVQDSLYFTSGLKVTQTVSILVGVHNILFSVGHWKLVFQFFVSAVDTNVIMWKSVDWNS